MPGFEYQVAFNLIYSGFLEEGLTLIQSIRDRFDGKKRNPFCEFEWGNHYGRSLITFTGMIALARFRYSGVDRSLQFAPQFQPEDARQFFSVGAAWGTISQSIQANLQTLMVNVDKGRIDISEFLLKASRPVKTASAAVGGKTFEGKLTRNQDPRRPSAALARIVLSDTLAATPGNPVKLELQLS
jgi:hypothetical protein